MMVWPQAMVTSAPGSDLAWVGPGKVIPVMLHVRPVTTQRWMVEWLMTREVASVVTGQDKSWLIHIGADQKYEKRNAHNWDGVNVCVQCGAEWRFGLLSILIVGVVLMMGLRTIYNRAPCYYDPDNHGLSVGKISILSQNINHTIVIQPLTPALSQAATGVTKLVQCKASQRWRQFFVTIRIINFKPYLWRSNTFTALVIKCVSNSPWGCDSLPLGTDHRYPVERGGADFTDSLHFFWIPAGIICILIIAERINSVGGRR